MADLATSCGMSKKTVYKLFESKDDVIQTVVAQLTSSYTAAYALIRQKQHSAPEEVLDAIDILEKAFSEVNRRFLEELQKFHYCVWQKITSFREEVLLDFIKSNILRGQAQGHYHSRFDNDIIAGMRLRELIALHESLATAADYQQLHKTLIQVSLHYLAGLVTPAGLKRVERHPLYSNASQGL